MRGEARRARYFSNEGRLPVTREKEEDEDEDEEDEEEEEEQDEARD